MTDAPKIVAGNVSYDLIDRLGLKQAELKLGDGGGNSGGMEARIARLEAHAEHAQADLNTLKSDSSAVRERLSRLEERVAHLPSKGFIVSVAVAGIGLLSAVIGLAVAYQDLLSGLTNGG